MVGALGGGLGGGPWFRPRMRGGGRARAARPAAAVACAAMLVVAMPASTGRSDPQGPAEPVAHLGDRYVTKPPGTVERFKFFYGPYVVPPGNDINRYDVDLPMRNGFVEGIRASLVRSSRSEERRVGK